MLRKSKRIKHRWLEIHFDQAPPLECSKKQIIILQKLKIGNTYFIKVPREKTSQTLYTLYKNFFKTKVYPFKIKIRGSILKKEVLRLKKASFK